MKTLIVAVLISSLAACSASPTREASTPTESEVEQPQETTESQPMEHDHEHGAHHHDPAAHKHDGMQHRFEDVERWTKVFDNPERDAWQKPAEVVALMEIAAGSTVADIGAGTGYFMPHLSEAVGAEGQVLSLDIEPKLVEHMTARAAEAGFTNVEARVIQPDDPQIDAGTADRILIVNTWHHISEREAYAKKLAAGVADGGAIFIVEFTLETERGPKHHKLSPEVVIAELETAGLKAATVEETLPDQYIVRATR